MADGRTERARPAHGGDEHLFCTNPRAACLGALLGSALACVPTSAQGVEIGLGVSVGGMVAGSAPRLAISPHGEADWRLGRFVLAIHGMLSLLPDDHGLGVVGQLSPAAGIAWEWGDVRLGPSLAFFSMPMCGLEVCARMNGVAPGGSAQASVHLGGPLWLAANGSVDWVDGVAGILPARVVGMAVAGPVLRWDLR